MNDFSFTSEASPTSPAAIKLTQGYPDGMPLESYFRISTCYAGIGSRKTPRPILILMTKIAGMLADYGLTLRSGGAPGADTAFENGCDQRKGMKEIFLPWNGFNHHPSPFFNPPGEAEILASFYHPNWTICKSAARKLHARNCQQVVGLNLDKPVDFVLLWAPEEKGRIQGGTATAVNLAREMEIPTFNLWDESTRERWKGVIDVHRSRQDFFLRRVLSWLRSAPASSKNRG